VAPRMELLDPAGWPVMAGDCAFAGASLRWPAIHFCSCGCATARRPARRGSTGVVSSLSVSPPEGGPLAALSWCRPCRGAVSAVTARLVERPIAAGWLLGPWPGAWEQRVTVGGSADHGSRATQ